LKLQDVRDGGRAVGLVLADELVLAMYRSPAAYGLTNVTQGACTVVLPACDQTTTQDSVAGQSYGGYWLWADDTHLGPAAQSRLGSLAISRARSNPF
jgi:phospholipase/lecithinase/hemolysin